MKFNNGELLVIGARTGHGKSYFLKQVAEQYFLNSRPVLIDDVPTIIFLTLSELINNYEI